MEQSQKSVQKLTKNQTMVFNALSRASGPMSAYGLLDELRENGLRAPLQVYRALDKLVERGLVHRLETLNAFVACRHPHCEAEETVAFTICDDCGRVEEISDHGLSQQLMAIAKEDGFRVSKSTIELRGCCDMCREKGCCGLYGEENAA